MSLMSCLDGYGKQKISRPQLGCTLDLPARSESYNDWAIPVPVILTVAALNFKEQNALFVP
jgi:hypothetical protein